MDTSTPASQAWSMEVHLGSYPSSLNGDGQRPEYDEDSALALRVTSHTAIREEYTSGYVRGIQDEMQKKETHRKKTRHAVRAYTHSATQKVREAIGSHTELVPTADSFEAWQLPTTPVADEGDGAPESAQQENSTVTPERGDSALPTDSEGKR